MHGLLHMYADFMTDSPRTVQQQTALATTKKSFRNPDVHCEQVCTYLSGAIPIVYVLIRIREIR
jgi:hypothetical protein